MSLRNGLGRPSSWRNLLAAALLPAALAGCGFEPIAAVPTSFGEQDLTLSSLNVSASDSRFAYRVRKEMLRSIEIDPTASQSLSVSTQITKTGLAIEQNDTVTRQNVTARTNYKLSTARPAGVEGDPTIIAGETRAVTAVNTTTSQFSASVSEREANERLSVETARRLITFLRVNRPSAVNGR